MIRPSTQPRVIEAPAEGRVNRPSAGVVVFCSGMEASR